MSSGSRLETDGLSLTICFVDTFGAQRLGGQNNTLLLTLGDVDGTLSLTFGFENLSTLGSLGSDLSVHGLDNGARGVNISDLVTKAGNTPSFGGIIDGSGDVGVECSTFLQDMVKGQLTNLGSHSCLGELRDGIFGVLNSVAVHYVSPMSLV